MNLEWHPQLREAYSEMREQVQRLDRLWCERILKFRPQTDSDIEARALVDLDPTIVEVRERYEAARAQFSLLQIALTRADKLLLKTDDETNTDKENNDG